jgi:4-hydroxybenzoate polyprenyltransferase
MPFMLEGRQATNTEIEVNGATSVWSLLSCIRYREVLLLQGAPFMGIIFSVGSLTVRKIPTIALFGLASFLLVAHIWSLNDCADFHVDRLDENKSADTASSKGIDFPMMHRFSLLLLVPSLGLFSLLPLQTLLVAVCVAILGFLYSSSSIAAKGVAFLSSVLHFIGGGLHFLLGYALFMSIDRHAMLIAPFFALIFTAGHATQEVQDYDADRLFGIRTNAVVFGKRPVFIAALIGFTFAYGYLAYLALAGIVPTRLGLLSLILFPLHLFWSVKTLHRGLTFERLIQFRIRYRMLFALMGLAMISTLFL